MRGVPVVVDINVLLDAIVSDDEDAAFESFPSPPPLRGDANATVLGILNDAREVSLWQSPHVVDGVRRVLADPEGFGWDRANADRYCALLEVIATRSGGGVLVPDVEVSNCRDWEGNRILELAESAGALLVISNDDDLQRMSPWRGIPVMSAAQFVQRIDVGRRAELSRAGGGPARRRPRTAPRRSR